MAKLRTTPPSPHKKGTETAASHQKNSASQYTWVSCPIGDFLIFAHEEKIVATDFVVRKSSAKSSSLPDAEIQKVVRKTSARLGLKECLNTETPILRKAATQLREYFAGKRKVFDLPLAIPKKGTEFQKKAWQSLCKIPFGTTTSYGAQAAAMGCASAVRAVGSANGRNPLPILIPCHRVIQKNGHLGGYSGGIKVKEYLLKLEGLLTG